MIINLHVQNVALIDEAEVQFGEGLNILTGETGAGKSILIDSLNFLLGGRVQKDFVRSGAETAQVEGLLSVNAAEREALAALDIQPDEEGQLLFSRTLTTAGRSVCRINGKTATVGMLKEAAAALVEIHGQHQHQSLLNPARHIVLLDRFCGEKIAVLKAELAAQIENYRATAKSLKALTGAPGARESELEILEFQQNEIASAKLKLGEEETLTAKRDRLGAADKLHRAATESLALLYGTAASETAALDKIGRASALLTEMARLDESTLPLSENLAALSVSLSEIAAEIRDYVHELDADPSALERMESRLDTIYRLKKKYGGAEVTVEAVLAHHAKISARLDALRNSEAEIARLTAKRRTEMKQIADKCNELTALRRQTAEKITGRIIAVLQDLGMPHVQFSVAFEKQAAFSANGNDRLEFLLSANPGESLKPLSQVASGGEMSRVMLALKSVLADADGIGALIFDEIDAGVSGRTAQKVAEKLAEIAANNRQILCITHLPQIAAMAARHYLIAKLTDGEKTRTTVRELSHTGAVHELARLIGGAEITPATVRAAEELKRRPT